MALKKLMKTTLILGIITLGNLSKSYGEELSPKKPSKGAANSLKIIEENQLSQEANEASNFQVCQIYADNLEKAFNKLKKPRSKMLFFRSLRAKKYQVVRKNIDSFKGYVDTKITLLVGANSPKENDFFIKKCTAYYNILQDKILWIDNFRRSNLHYFPNTIDADLFFKKNNDVMSRNLPLYERKSDDYP